MKIGLDGRVSRRFIKRHLELELEVGNGAKPANDDVRFPARHVIDQEPVESIDFDVRLRLEDLPSDLDPFVHREQRRLFRVHEHRDDDAIEEPRAARDDVDVPVGERVERPGIDG